jgi:hypothetical protein
MDETIQQARQGSITALIQLMNERLEDVGIRTRAMVAEGILQILCEAASVEPLEKTQLLKRLKALLEELALPSFRRIRVNARIAREQQLLWLDEINRDPANQLLWSEEIKLTPPNLLQRFGRYYHQQKRGADSKPKLNPWLTSARSRSHPYWQGAIGGIALSLLMVGGIWMGLRWRERRVATTQEVRLEQPTSTAASGEVQSASSPPSDPFVEAIRLAESSALKGQTAKTPAEWLELAAKWQRASELMQSVPTSDPRSATARERATVYRKNSEMAQTQARRFQ